MSQLFQRGLLGGTFDHFHKGHEKLLTHALEKCALLELWVTSEKMAYEKKGWIETYETRIYSIKKWIKENKLENRIEIFKLSDKVGPAETREDCDAIVCTEETLPRCEKINSTRIKSNLKPLEIIIVDHLFTEDKIILSSSLIRLGEYNRKGEKWINYKHISKKLHMPKSAEKGLKKPLGVLYEGPEDDTSIAIENAIRDLTSRTGKIVAVGDICVSALRDKNIIPDIAVVDGMTKREILPDNLKPNKEGYDEIISCVNPAGCISPQFSDCLIAAAKADHKVMIIVEGEEDLAPIILHLALPLDSFLIYGQPHKGIVMCRSSEYAKTKCKLRLEEFT